MKSRLVIMSGPSGVGKDTLLDRWMDVNPFVTRVITYTTRHPRRGELNGRDYVFVDRDRFEILAKSGHFWEYKEVHGNMYGSPKVDTQDILERGDVPVLKIDVQGALDVMRQRPDALTIFIMPPSLEELDRRIRKRGVDDEAVIAQRLEAAHKEISYAGHYKFKIVNDDLETAVQALEDALKS